MIIIGSDIETTGLLGKDGTPGDQRIIEVYAGVWDLATRSKIDEYFQRINPHRSITPKAQEVHKISAADLVGCPAWEDVAEAYRGYLEHGDVTVWHNGDGFDIPFINGELDRISRPRLTKPTFDTMVNGRWSTPLGAVPNLGALCFACDVPYDASIAHAADYDVEVMMECFFRGLDWGWFKLEAPAMAMAA